MRCHRRLAVRDDDDLRCGGGGVIIHGQQADEIGQEGFGVAPGMAHDVVDMRDFEKAVMMVAQRPGEGFAVLPFDFVIDGIAHLLAPCE